MEKRGRGKGTETYLKKCLKTSLIWKMKQTSRYRKHRVPKMNLQRCTPRHVYRMAKDEDNFIDSRRKTTESLYKENHIKITC